MKVLSGNLGFYCAYLFEQITTFFLYVSTELMSVNLIALISSVLFSLHTCILAIGSLNVLTEKTS